MITGRLTVKNGIYQAIINYKKDDKYKNRWISTGLKEQGNKRRAEKFLKEKIAEFEQDAQNSLTTLELPEVIRQWLEVAKTRVRKNS